MTTPAEGIAGNGLLRIRRGEYAVTAASFLYFGLVLASYYTLRPVRDALTAGVIGATEVRYAFLIVFITMLLLVPVFGTLASKLPRRRLIPVVYVFFIGSIIAFHWLFDAHLGATWLAYAFFVWLSVFNLFVVSVFWSFMADIFDPEQARRLFGPIAAGGSVGALAGPAVTALLVESIGVSQLMLVSAALLTAALACMLWLSHHAPRRDVEQAPAMGGSPLAGLMLAARDPFLRSICGFMILGTFTGALLYLQQVKLVAELSDQTERLASVFARVDFAVNLGSILIQLFLTSRILRWLGFAGTLLVLPVIMLISYGALTLVPSLTLVIAMQILRRGVLFSVTNPVSQMLFAAVGPQSRYKFKNFLDTAVYRAGDTTASWVFAGMLALGAALPAVSAVGAVMASIWCMVSWRVGRGYQQITDGEREAPP